MQAFPMVRRIVSVHESTVKKAAKGEFKKSRKRRQGSKSSRVVTVQAIDPMLVKWMKENGVSMKDVEIVSPTQIIVK